MKDIPKIGQIYNCFDDGKITHSRLYTVEVIDVIPFNRVDQETLNKWSKEVKDCYWLYAKETDYFIKTLKNRDESIFVRTLDGGWFAIDGFLDCGRLDVDGELTNRLNKGKYN